MPDAGRGVRRVAARAVAVPREWPAATRRRAQAVLGLSTVIALAAVPTAVAVWFLLPDPQIHLAVIVLGLPVYLLIRSLVRRGRVSLAAWLLIGYFLLVPFVGSVLIGESSAAPFFVVLGVLLAGLVLPPRGALLAGAVSVAVLVITSQVIPPSPRYTWEEVRTYLLLVLGLATVAATAGALLFDVAFRAADRSRRHAQQLADELLETNATLELHVQLRTEELAVALEREQRLSQMLAELSVHDPLTGLYNRRHLTDELIRLGAFAERTGNPLSLAIIDLDDFKQVNDRYSHMVGDDVLRSAAEVLAADTRASDVLVRLGGEEFALLMPGTDTAGAVEVCERMRVDLQAHAWREIQPDLRITASFGVATSNGDLAPDQLMYAADTQLLAAKRLGKNRVTTSAA